MNAIQRTREAVIATTGEAGLHSRPCRNVLALSCAGVLALSLALASPRPSDAQHEATESNTAASASDLGLLADPGDDLAITYEHVDTWQDVPWQLTPGRFGSVDDVSSDWAGNAYVLDAHHQAVHVIDPSGVPASVIDLKIVDEAFPTPKRLRAWSLDVAPDGTLYILSHTGRPFEARIDILTPGGTPSGVEHVIIEESLRTVTLYLIDLAIVPDGSIVVTARPNTRKDQGAILVHNRVTGVTDFHQPPELARPIAVDVDTDGVVHILQERCYIPIYNTPVPRTPRPTATPRPSLKVGDRPVRAPNKPADTVADTLEDPGADPMAASSITADDLVSGGLLILEPDMSFRSLDPTVTGEQDLATLRGEIALARSSRLKMYPGLPSWDWKGHTTWSDAPSAADIGAAGSADIMLSFCRLTGLNRMADSTDPASDTMRIGERDRSKLPAPYHPIRLAADDDVVVLEGEVEKYGSSNIVLPINFTSDWDDRIGNSVQRWTLDGDSVARYPQCPIRDDMPARDVARVGEVLYTIRRHELELQSAGGEWINSVTIASSATGEVPELVSVAADGVHVAVLDIGQNAVHIFTADGTLLYSWSIDESAPNTLPVDIAMRGDRIYLADIGRDRIVVRGLYGASIGEFPTYDGPWRLATAPIGTAGEADPADPTDPEALDLAPGDDLFVMGRGGWGLRYSPTGILRAAWPFPERSDVTRDDTDIAVAKDGRVYVSYRKLEVLTAAANPPTAITDAGIDVFSPLKADPKRDPDPPELGACLVSRTKTASPSEIILGQEVDVTLRVDGECPGRFEKAQIIMLFDTSWSMSWNDAWNRAKRVMLPLLAELDPDQIELGLVTFDDGGALEVPLTSDIGKVRARIATTDELELAGDTRMGAGIELARLELGGERRDPEARQIIWLVTDGVFKDDPVPAAEAARLDGMDIHAFVFDTREFKETHKSVLGEVTGDTDKVYMRPTLEERRALARDAASYIPVDGLMSSLTVDDVIPDNMRYVEDSGVPPATMTDRTLRWTFIDVTAKDGAEMTYKLKPLQLGRWPTNVEATGDFFDALGHDGRVVFPIPEVVVSQPLYLPILSMEGCIRPREPVELMILLDRSSSMAETVGSGAGAPSKLEAATEGARLFIERLNPDVDRVALIGFHAEPGPIVGLTANHGKVVTALESLTTGYGTRIDHALAGANLLRRSARAGSRTVVLLITDGKQIGPGAPVLYQADLLRSADVDVYAIGIGDEVDRENLYAITGGTEHVRLGAGEAVLDELHGWIVGKTACTKP